VRWPDLASLPAPPPGALGWPWTASVPETEEPGDWPPVGIVTPSYNQGQFLEATIRSVLLQGYPNLEYRVLDGGSTDGSVAVLERYAPWLTEWVSQPDAGQADAIQRGWERSSGEYLGWLNSDDLLTPGSLRAAASTLREHPGWSGVYGDVLHVDPAGRPLGIETYEDFDLVRLVRHAGWISQPGSLFRRSALDAVGGLDTTLRYLMDLDLWLRLGSVAPLGYLRDVSLAMFREHDEAKSSTRRGLAAEEITRIVTRFFEQALPDSLRAVEREALSSAHLYAARAWSAAGEPQRALAEIGSAVAAHPRCLLSTGPVVATAHVGLSALLGARRAAAVRRWRLRRLAKPPRSRS